jgi:hypothetical protein
MACFRTSTGCAQGKHRPRRKRRVASWGTAAGKARLCLSSAPRSYREGMETNPFNGGTPGKHDDQAPEGTNVPLTSGGERSTSIDEDDAGILPTPEPTDGGAPAP